MVELQWSKTPENSWWLFDQVEPRQLNYFGVFVVWRNGSGVKVSAVMYVGRGALRDEFARCRRDPAFRGTGLYVTWARVDDASALDPIAAHLYRELRPLWGDVVPLVAPIRVNVPLTAA